MSLVEVSHCRPRNVDVQVIKAAPARSVCRWNACSPGIYDQAVTVWRISLCTECQWDAGGRSLCGTRLRAVDDRDVPRM